MKCLISLILIACSFVTTATHADDLDPYSFMTKIGKGKPFPIIIKDEVPAYLKYESGVVYTPGPDTKERDLDILYHADHKTVKRPAIVILHGGGWKSGDSTRGHEIMAIYATQGYVTISINYRLSGTAIAPAAVHDSKLAIRWTRANAEKYGIDPDRIGCTGGSAGGHLTAMMAVTDPSDGVEGPYLEAYSSSVQAAMPLSGGYDLRGSDPRFVDPFLGGRFGSRKKGLTDQMSPVVLVRPEKRETIPPMLIVHSDKEMVPVEQFEVFLAALNKIGRKEKTILLPGKGHGHMLIRVPKVREAADKFFRQHLDPQPPAVASKSSGQTGRDLIRRENAKPGTRDWMLTNTRIDPKTWWRCPWIEGYCSATSVRAGDTLKIMMSTNPVSKFSLEIFRTGYYGGTGGRLMKRFDSLSGKTQANPPIGENRLRECQWEPSVELTIPNDWLSGVYLGKLTAEKEGLQSYVIFIVRDDRPCDLLFQCSDMTWAAYNSWPDDRWSLYHDDKEIYKPNGRKKWSTGPDTGWVSFDRPYALFCQDHLVDNPSAQGSGEFLLWEFPLSYWLEQNGYDVSYISNVDMHADGPGLHRAKGFISVGHDEYWTREMFDNVSAARDAGVNLAFLSGNSVWGVVPLLPSSDDRPHRIIRRENVFLGEDLGRQFQKATGFEFKYPPGPDAGLLMGGRMAGIGNGAWTCAKPEHWLFEGTGMKAGDGIEALVGWEYHGYPVRDLPGFQIVAEGETRTRMGKKLSKPYTATMYDGPKGNVVFNAATIWWAQGLSSPPGHVLPKAFGANPKTPDPRVQRMTENLFKRFTEKEM